MDESSYTRFKMPTFRPSMAPSTSGNSFVVGSKVPSQVSSTGSTQQSVFAHLLKLLNPQEVQELQRQMTTLGPEHRVHVMQRAIKTALLRRQEHQNAASTTSLAALPSTATATPSSSSVQAATQLSSVSKPPVSFPPPITTTTAPPQAVPPQIQQHLLQLKRQQQQHGQFLMQQKSLFSPSVTTSSGILAASPTTNNVASIPGGMLEAIRALQATQVTEYNLLGQKQQQEIYDALVDDGDMAAIRERHNKESFELKHKHKSQIIELGQRGQQIGVPQAILSSRAPNVVGNPAPAPPLQPISQLITPQLPTSLQATPLQISPASIVLPSPLQPAMLAPIQVPVVPKPTTEEEKIALIAKQLEEAVDNDTDSSPVIKQESVQSAPSNSRQATPFGATPQLNLAALKPDKPLNNYSSASSGPLGLVDATTSIKAEKHANADEVDPSTKRSKPDPELEMLASSGTNITAQPKPAAPVAGTPVAINPNSALGLLSAMKQAGQPLPSLEECNRKLAESQGSSTSANAIIALFLHQYRMLRNVLVKLTFLH